VPAGGAEYLATHLRTREAENRNTLILSAGDLIGASPLLSALFHDEPTIEAMNKIGLDLNAVGNHEFDEGAHELLRMQNADFTFARSGAEGDGNVTYGEAFTVQPFGNSLVTLTLTGAQMLELLKQQWCTQEFARVLLPSAGVSYSYSQSAATALLGQPCEGAANPVSNLSIGGVAVDPAATYRITVNSFLADGGDKFTVLREGTDRLGGEVDTDALEAYIAPSLTGAPVAPPALDRFDVVP
jgi:2',3'-cyclic-nucleotide 2'-phosphodiesterase (5'-nucleotidase family)